MGLRRPFAAAQRFADRQEAGRLLGQRLRDMDLGLTSPVVLGLPRGGVEVAAPVAQLLDAPLDIVVVRKIGAPGQPEYGVGAVAEAAEPHLVDDALRRLQLRPDALAPVIAAEREELARRVAAYRRGRAPVELTYRDAVVVDDGLATGVTARAAVRSVRARGAGRIVLAVPVASPQAASELLADADDVVCLLTPRDFRAVGGWYVRFGQTDDETVLELLDNAAGRRG